MVPVLNEEYRLRSGIETLRTFLCQRLPLKTWRVLIAENGSTDRTRQIAEELVQIYPEVQALHLAQSGRGRALRFAWSQSQAEIVAYMDLDLATDLEAFPLLLERLNEGSDLAIGSRRIPGAQVIRSRKREFLSRAYHRFLRWLFHPPFIDAQCGFKAMRRAAILPLLQEVRSRGWFFDTELLLRAHWKRLRIQEIPVRWVESPDSRVRLPSTILQMGWGLIRMKWQWAANGHAQ